MLPIYMDYNATTPIAREVQEAMLPFLAEHYGNPSSNHFFGRATREAVEDARQRVAQWIGAQRGEIIFTSGGTESNNMALRGVLRAKEIRDRGDRGHLVISSIEHPAILEPARWLQKEGFGLSLVPPNRDGTVLPDSVEQSLRPDTVLVSIMHANNEVGAIQPIGEIARRCHARGVLVHTDAAQSSGKIPTRVDDLGVDLMSIAGHKVYAPKGVGALYLREGTPMDPVLRGAGHENGLRPGTENVASIVGLAEAASTAESHLIESQKRMAHLRDRLQTALARAIGERMRVHGLRSERLPNTLSVNFPGVSGEDLLRRFPELCASTGAACHSGMTHVSPTLAAMEVGADDARGTIRLSLGRYTSEEDVERTASGLISAWENAIAG